MRLKKMIAAVFFTTVICSNSSSAQKKIETKSETASTFDYSKEPVWIKMIDDPNANYYEAIKAYDLYWKDKIKPIKEEDILNEKLNEKEKEEYELLEKQIAAMTPAEKNEYDLMVYQCKRFSTWKRESLPFVQEDGHILTIEERQQIYYKQQEEIKNK